MKRLFSYLIVLLVWLFTGCDKTFEEPKPEVLPPIIVNEASDLSKNLFANWLSSSRLTESYSTEELYKIKDTENDMVMWVAPSINQSNMSLSFAILKDGSVTKPLNHLVNYINEDTIQDKIALIDGTWLATITITRDGNRSVEINEQLFANGRIQGWWSDFDDCFGQLNAPIPDCNTCNWLFGTVANATTAFLYTPASVLVCAGVATGQAIKD